MKTTSFDAIGTRWSVDIYDPLSDERMIQITSQIRQRIASFEKTYSRFRTDSLVHLMSRKAGSYNLPDEGIEMLRLYKKLYDITEGSMTPLIGSVMEQAGYDSSYSLKPGTLHTPPNWGEALEIGTSSLRLLKPALLDLGALGKGALLDRVADVLRENHVTAFCLDAGGDILYRNPKDVPLTVGLEHPLETDRVIGITTILNQSIAASSGNRRKWGAFHHLIDPKTLRPVTATLASWVIAETAMLADGLATAVFFTDPKTLAEHFSFSYLMLKPDMTVIKSDDFPGELYYT